MDNKEFIIGWMRRLGIIHGFTMMMVYLLSALFKPDAVFDVSFLGNMILFSFAGTLPGLIYIAKHDLSEKEWWIRTGIHFVLLNVLELPIAHAIGLWKGIGGLFMFIGVILVIDVMVHIVCFGFDWIAVRDINRKLEQRRKKEAKS